MWVEGRLKGVVFCCCSVFFQKKIQSFCFNSTSKLGQQFRGRDGRPCLIAITALAFHFYVAFIRGLKVLSNSPEVAPRIVDVICNSCSIVWRNQISSSAFKSAVCPPPFLRVTKKKMMIDFLAKIDTRCETSGRGIVRVRSDCVFHD